MKMKQLIGGAVIVTGIYLMAPTHAAAVCVVPPFLKEGKTYNISPLRGSSKNQVLEIDKQTCWIKVRSEEEEYAKRVMREAWLNLNQMHRIEETNPEEKGK